MNNKDSPMLNISQVSEHLSLSEWTVRKMLRSGEIKGSKIRNRWRVRPSDLNSYIESKSN